MGNMDVSTSSWTTVSTEMPPSPLHRNPALYEAGSVLLPATAASPRTTERSSATNGKPRYSMELESAPSTRSWAKRIKGFRNTRTHRGSSTPTGGEEMQYVGGTMDDATPVPIRHNERGTYAASQRVEKPATMNTFERIRSWMTANSSQHDEESLVDFEESEWTPPDSSYGAALPVFGWIPKHTRRYIELAMMLLMILFLVYLVVMLSIVITEARRDDIAEDNGLGLDDDRYIDYAEDKADTDDYEIDDDTHWSSSSNSNGGERYRW